ncbi:MAG: hypothetical protein AAB898_02175 [Patescibacteria group bacterium]
MTPYSDQKGVALFLSVLVMGVVALAVLLELTQGSINAIADVHDQSDAALARAAAFGCLDEVLIQLVGDSAWSEASVTLPTTTCAVTAVSSATTDILITATSGDVTRGVAANVTLDPFVVNDIQEALTL